MNTDIQPDMFLALVIDAAIAAGDAALAVYEQDFAVEEKDDHSPLTLADRRSHEIIADALKKTEIPVLSEEGRDIPHAERKNWPALWIVDPLDGTKEFVKKNGEFTVNIALVRGGRPVLGVIYVPVTGMLYFAADGSGAFSALRSRIPAGYGENLAVLMGSADRLPVERASERPFTIMGSRSHATPELSAYVEELKKQHPDAEFISAGSSLKFCRVAEGAADIYPRMGPTMEWDTAAGQAIAEMAGAVVLNWDTAKPLAYNKPELTNPWFVVKRGGA